MYPICLIWVPSLVLIDLLSNAIDRDGDKSQVTQGLQFVCFDLHQIHVHPIPHLLHIYGSSESPWCAYYLHRLKRRHHETTWRAETSAPQYILRLRGGGGGG
ncbi:hypothetical protein F4775DRAFT_560742, partial [Biscogniauxia sp. FL1348]